MKKRGNFVTDESTREVKRVLYRVERGSRRGKMAGGDRERKGKRERKREERYGSFFFFSFVTEPRK